VKMIVDITVLWAGKRGGSYISRLVMLQITDCEFAIEARIVFLRDLVVPCEVLIVVVA